MRSYDLNWVALQFDICRALLVMVVVEGGLVLNHQAQKEFFAGRFAAALEDSTSLYSAAHENDFRLNFMFIEGIDVFLPDLFYTVILLVHWKAPLSLFGSLHLVFNFLLRQFKGFVQGTVKSVSLLEISQTRRQGNLRRGKIEIIISRYKEKY